MGRRGLGPRPVAVAVLMVVTHVTGVFAAASGVGYPSKPVTLVVPFAAGGTADVVARAISGPLSNALGQNVVVVNKPGGGGVPGMLEVKGAPPDGYTILLGTVQYVTLHPTRVADLSYRDYEVIATVNLAPAALAVRKDARWQSLEQLLDELRARPRSVSVGTSARSGAWNIFTRLLERRWDVSFNIIEYGAGASPAVTALAGGHIDAAMAGTPEVLAFVESGDIRLLGVTSSKRVPLFGAVPTFDELGVSGFNMAAFHTAAVPKGTPHEIVRTLERAFLNAAHSTEYRRVIEQSAMIPVAMGREESLAFLREQEELYQTVLVE
ncbi:MAG: tripartite tricarboxylate transporter substrate binding protein [Bacillota bacterium]